MLRNSAAISLLFYGNEGAIQLLDEEAREVPAERRETLGELLEMGRSRKDEKRKVIDLSGDGTRLVVSDPAERRLVYSSGGHDAPVLQRRGLVQLPGHAEKLEVHTLA